MQRVGNLLCGLAMLFVVFGSLYAVFGSGVPPQLKAFMAWDTHRASFVPLEGLLLAMGIYLIYCGVTGRKPG